MEGCPFHSVDEGQLCFFPGYVIEPASSGGGCLLVKKYTMKFKFNFPGLCILLALLSLATQSCHPKHEIYEATFESLEKHQAPEWFSDAKFGIFVHWGVYAVPAYHEWYMVYYSPNSHFARNLGGPPYTAAQGELSDSVFRANIQPKANAYHIENFGVDFPYDDFIPMFKAENYQPEEWAELFEKAGARYVVFTAKHGEEFAMWPSKFTPRNAKDMGPKRDLTGDLIKAVRARDMKMGLYHNTTYSFYDERFPNKEWVEYMNNSIKELVDLYHPDILWGDVVTSPARNEQNHLMGADHFNSFDLLAYFYNNSPDPSQVLANDRFGLVTGVETDSYHAMKHSVWKERVLRWNVEENTALLGDYQTPERRRVDQIFDFPWETCDALDPTSWGYNRNLPDEGYMSTDQLVDYLVDVVSKNGNLLINVGPRADGTIPEVQQRILLGMGEWLEINGEAIYGSRPWHSFGEGDLRFTTKGEDTLYAIAMTWPGETLLIPDLKDWADSDIKSTSLLGLEQELEWELSEQGLLIHCPAEAPCEHAFSFKILHKKQ